MSSNIIKSQLEVYQNNFIQNDSSPKGTYQNNLTTIHERFGQLLTEVLSLKEDNFSIVDFGAGVGDFYTFTKQRVENFDYLGIEIVPEMIKKGKELNPEAKIINTDFMDPSYSTRADFFIVSGTFNMIGNNDLDVWERFFYSSISKMFELSNIGVIFNTLNFYSTFHAENLFYLDPGEFIAYSKSNLSRFVNIKNSSPLYENTISVIKPEFMKAQYNHKDFEKYFR